MKVLATEVDGVLHLVCSWFAECTNPTLKATQHPVLGPVPICKRCAKRAGVTDKLIDCEVSAS